MKNFEVTLMPEAQADIKRLDPAIQTRILDKLEWMGENAELLHHQALQGQEWSGCFKYRVGDYRIIYQVDWSVERLLALKDGTAEARPLSDELIANYGPDGKLAGLEILDAGQVLGQVEGRIVFEIAPALAAAVPSP